MTEMFTYKELHYNNYGAPIEQNPRWCNLLSWLLNRIGGLFYPRIYSIAIWFWSKAYAWGDIQCYSKIKGYCNTLNARGLR